MAHSIKILGSMIPCRMHKSWRIFLTAVAVVAAGADVQASSYISSLSAPLKLDDTHYYAYAQFNNGIGVTWDTANSLVNALPAYNGQSAQLATFATDAQYTWFVSNESGFTSPIIDTWDIAWIGANNVGGTYTWLNGQGTIAADSLHWSAGPPQEPVSGNYGVDWAFSGYGDVWETRSTGYNSISNAIVLYAVPEPGTVGLALASLLGVAALRRRAVRR